jgi:glycosyltransferase involved in cell wall biosynthesis
MKDLQQKITPPPCSAVGSENQAKLIYLDVAGKMHSLYKELLLSPPMGYRFTSAGSDWDKVSNIVSRTDILYSIQLNVLARLLPPNLVKASLERFKQPPRGTVLTYSIGHLVFRKEPWIVDMEFVTQLTGYKLHHFKRFRRVIEKVLASDYCKGIICWTEAGKKTVLLNLKCENFADKVEVVPLVVRKKNFVKDYNNNGKNVKLLFVGSANIPGEFEYKGGKEVLEAFFILRKKYKNIELVVRSDIPPALKAKYSGRLENVKLIEGIVPWVQLEQEFKTADVFLFPTHSTPGLAILDAMSYELPVITTDVWANTELVEDGKTGFLIEKSNKIPYYTENFIPNWSYYPTSKFMKTIKKIMDPQVVKQLVEKTSVLIEDEELRKKMGKAGRQQIETGRFSIEKRNEKLKRIFDEATGRV